MLRRIVNNYRRYRKICETEAELYRLSKRDLADLGISRCDIPAIAREAVA